MEGEGWRIDGGGGMEGGWRERVWCGVKDLGLTSPVSVHAVLYPPPQIPVGLQMDSISLSGLHLESN